MIKTGIINYLNEIADKFPSAAENSGYKATGFYPFQVSVQHNDGLVKPISVWVPLNKKYDDPRKVKINSEGCIAYNSETDTIEYFFKRTDSTTNIFVFQGEQKMENNINVVNSNITVGGSVNINQSFANEKQRLIKEAESIIDSNANEQICNRWYEKTLSVLEKCNQAAEMIDKFKKVKDTVKSIGDWVKIAIPLGIKILTGL